MCTPTCKHCSEIRRLSYDLSTVMSCFPGPAPDFPARLKLLFDAIEEDPNSNIVKANHMQQLRDLELVMVQTLSQLMLLMLNGTRNATF